MLREALRQTWNAERRAKHTQCRQKLNPQYPPPHDFNSAVWPPLLTAGCGYTRMFAEAPIRSAPSPVFLDALEDSPFARPWPPGQGFQRRQACSCGKNPSKNWSFLASVAVHHSETLFLGQKAPRGRHICPDGNYKLPPPNMMPSPFAPPTPLST